MYTIKDSHNLKIIRNNCSRRFTQDIADFSNMLYEKDPIISVFEPNEPAMGVYQILINDVNDYIKYYKPDILRFDKRTQTLGYPALNFGVSKGMTVDRVLIFPNGPLVKFLSNLDDKLSAPDKYYVGITRARYSLAFVVDKLKLNDHFIENEIDLGDKK